MADVQGFRAVRYSGAAGPLADLVAPPYDAISQEEREQLGIRSPYNVVHLTLPDSVEHAGQLYRTWLSEGVLKREAEPAAWFIAEEYTGPDGVGRERRGIVASLAAEPYETGTVLPHERTYRRTKEERLQLLRETLVYPEPLFLLVDGSLGVDRPETAPDVEVSGTRLWRLPDTDAGSLLGDAQLLIADGHHRYETALVFGAEAPAEENRVMALIVSTGDPGLHVFPTHRVFSGRPDLRDGGEDEQVGNVEEALVRLAEEPYERSVAIAYRKGGAEIVHGREGELDVELVDRHGLDGITYTARTHEAIAAVDSGEADAAFLLREPRLEDVFAVARRGELMPSKSTYFFPKPLSGLLFHPVDR